MSDWCGTAGALPELAGVAIIMQAWAAQCEEREAGPQPKGDANLEGLRWETSGKVNLFVYGTMPQFFKRIPLKGACVQGGHCLEQQLILIHVVFLAQPESALDGGRT